MLRKQWPRRITAWGAPAGALVVTGWWGLSTGSLTFDDVAELLLPWTAVLIAVGIAFLVSALMSLIVRWLLRRDPAIQRQAWKGRVPLFCAFAGVLSVAAQNTQDMSEATATEQFVILVASAIGILSVGWLLAVALEVGELALLSQFSQSTPDPRRIAKFRTQILMLRHVLTAVIMVLSLSGVLMLVPQVRAFGTGLLASAGVLSVVAGLALQNSLSNLFAGIQIAFGDSVRVEDTLVVDGEQGQVEEMTLTYIVVRTPDNRRIILPSTYFVTTPFENWTRTDSKMTGFTVIELSAVADISAVRQLVTELLHRSEFWNRGENAVDVIGIAGGNQQVNIVVSADTPDRLYELQAQTRETVLAELTRRYPQALPAYRVTLTGCASAYGSGTALSPVKSRGEFDQDMPATG